jgi:large subunit ribosomal protein L21e
MVKRPRGPRSKTRHKLSKGPRFKGVPSVSKQVKVFPVGTVVSIHIEPSIHAGFPPALFHGLTGKIVERRGRDGYVVEFKAGKATKKVVTTASHLREMRSS